MSLFHSLSNLLFGPPAKRAEISYDMAMKAMAAGHLVVAEHHIKSALHYAPENTKYIIARGGQLLMKRDLEGARREFQKAFDLGDRSAVLLSNLGVVLRGLGKQAEALTKHQEAIKLAPDDCDTLLNAAVCYIDLRQFREAKELLLKVISIDPNRPEAHFNLAAIPGAEENEAQFVEHLDFASFKAELRPEVAFIKGRWLVKTGQLEEGSVQLKDAITSRPELCEAIESDERNAVLRGLEVYKEFLTTKPKQMFACMTEAECGGVMEGIRGGERKTVVVLGFGALRKEAQVNMRSILEKAGWKNFQLNDIRPATKQSLKPLGREVLVGWKHAEAYGAHIFVF